MYESNPNVQFTFYSPNIGNTCGNGGNYDQVRSLYGDNFTCSLTRTDSTIFNVGGYLPMEIDITNYVYVVANYWSLSGNNTITWNYDSHNTNGVAIILSKASSNNHVPVTIIVVPDNGSYTITKEQLAPYKDAIPTIDVTIVRGFVANLTGADNLTFQFVATTQSSALYEFR